MPAPNEIQLRFTSRRSGKMSQLELESKIYQGAPEQLCQNMSVSVNGTGLIHFSSSSPRSEKKLFTDCRLLSLPTESTEAVERLPRDKAKQRNVISFENCIWSHAVADPALFLVRPRISPVNMIFTMFCRHIKL